MQVEDEGLAMLRETMRQFGHEPKPNNIGRISDDPWDDPETYLVEFPIGDDPIDEHSQASPYPKSQVRPLDENHPDFEYWVKP